MNMLEIRGLTKVYPKFTLRDVNIDVPAGAIVGFIGRNGAGKSTTIKSALGLVHPDAGCVRFCGTDTREDEATFKQNIGVVLGGVDFYAKKRLRTITDVVRRFYPEWNDAKYRHYCELFALDEAKRVDELSNGMRVKYLIALALSHNACLLILDEPTSGLDPVSRAELCDLFAAIVADGSRSILFSTHITSDLERCATHIAFIKDGEMVFDGPIDAFLTENAEKGATLEEIIVALERRPLDARAIV